MPIKPNGGETEQEFISRCIPVEIEAGKEQSQAAAICYSIYREGKMKKAYESKVANKLLALNKKYEGLNLLPNGEVNMIEPNPCWDGYEAIGTKIVDGREVPNCVPVE